MVREREQKAEQQRRQRQEERWREKFDRARRAGRVVVFHAKVGLRRAFHAEADILVVNGQIAQDRTEEPGQLWETRKAQLQEQGRPVWEGRE
jgi:hypothetical protein